jgi:hypothetical protein
MKPIIRVLSATVIVGLAVIGNALAQTRGVDCAGYVAEPASPAEWAKADLNNQLCAAAGMHMVENNRAMFAAIQANAATPDAKFSADPFRTPSRWAGKRGTYQALTYQDRDGKPWPAALFGPRDLKAGPYPAVLLVCHVCGNTGPVNPMWYWASEALAEAGYVVLYAAVGGNNVPRAIDATDFLASTPSAPTPRGEFNPWHESIDRNRLAVVGHSGAAGVALSVGHADARYKTLVAWDPAGSYTMDGVTPRIPSMIQVADYRQESVPPPRSGKPRPELPKFAFFDTIRGANIDVMQIALRASMHFEWGPHFPVHSDPQRPYSIYGEIVSTYYTLAWLDRYLKPSARELSTRRLIAAGNARFDRFADAYSVGAGSFDAKKAEKAGQLEAGNVPVTIGGIPVQNLLSFQYESKYFLDGGAMQCANMRQACAATSSRPSPVVRKESIRSHLFGGRPIIY